MMMVQFRGMLLLAGFLASGQAALAQGAVPPPDTELRKQRFLRDILDPVNGAQARTVERDRQRCAGGVAPLNDRASRAKGIYFLPDSSDTCLATLTRSARDGNLGVLYRGLMKELTGDEEAWEHLPGAIGAAIAKGDAIVPLGNGKGMTLKPALAFDAGFTIGYQKGFPGSLPAVTAEKRKALAEACLDQQGSLKNCYVVGRMYGAQANGVTLSAR